MCLPLLGRAGAPAGAWRHVTLRGEQRLLRPLLVTGCKIWHMRPAGTFYPKVQLTNTLAAMPDGAQVCVCVCVCSVCVCVGGGTAQQLRYRGVDGAATGPAAAAVGWALLLLVARAPRKAPHL